jgi:hypothetical protein
MTPWEAREHVNFLLGEAVQHPQFRARAEAVFAIPARMARIVVRLRRKPRGLRLSRRTDRFTCNLGDVRRPHRVAQQSDVPELDHIDGFARGAGRPADAGAAKYRTAHAGRASAPGERADTFARPVFIVSPPRSGRACCSRRWPRRRTCTIGSESHAIFEGMPQLNIAHALCRRTGSMRCCVAESSPSCAAAFASARSIRAGKPVAESVRVLEKTPKNALRVPFIEHVFPQAHFVYLYRDVRETLASMIEAWQSGRFVTYPELPGWRGPPWSLLLIPGWSELAGKPVAEIVAAQWQATTNLLLDDLAVFPADRVTVARYDALLADPQAEISRLCAAVGLAWDQSLRGVLPPSQHTLSAPAPDKWRKHEREIEAVLPGLADTIARAERFAAR